MISKERLAERTFWFALVDGRLITKIVLAGDGSIKGSRSSNERSWSIEDGRLVFLSQAGKATTVFNEVNLTEDNKLSLRGEFLPRGPGARHALLEIKQSDPIERAAFAETVEEVLLHNILGSELGSYNLEKLAVLAASIDSSRYMVRHMQGAHRARNAIDLLSHAVRTIPPEGFILEFGVASGRTITHLANLLPHRQLFGFDSFKGLPETWRPGFGEGAFSRDQPPEVPGNVELVVGWFDRTLPGFLDQHPNDKAALIHVDCDLYSSTQTLFTQLKKRIVKGTIIVFDEYLNYPGWEQHEFLAFQEFVNVNHIHYEYIGVVPSHQQVAVRIIG